MHRFLISRPDLGIDAGFSPEMPISVHRFLISGPDLRIDVGFSPEMPLSVRRFLISGLDLGIDASFSRFTLSIRASILDFRARLENRCKVFLGNPL